MRRLYAISILIVCLCVAVGSADTFVAHSIDADIDLQTVDVEVTFDHLPDFLSVDSFGRSADELAMFIDPTSLATFPQDTVDGVLVGTIYMTIEDTLKIRPYGAPTYTHSLPYMLVGNTVSFSVPWNYVGETDGLFTWQLNAGEFGVQTDQIYGDYPPPPVVPLPKALSSGLGLLAGIALYLRRQRTLQTH